jgi:hypothetical protein
LVIQKSPQECGLFLSKQAGKIAHFQELSAKQEMAQLGGTEAIILGCPGRSSMARTSGNIKDLNWNQV